MHVRFLDSCFEIDEYRHSRFIVMQKATQVIVSDSNVRTVFTLVVTNFKYLLYFVVADSQFSASNPVNYFASFVIASIDDSPISHKDITQSESVGELLFR
jgi:hypothetical protein